MKITTKELELAYSIAKKYYDRELTITEAIDYLNKRGINKNSARGLVYNFELMMEGELFGRTDSTLMVEYYLEHILQDYGYGCLRKALQAVELNIDSKSTANAKKRALLNKYYRMEK